MSRPLSYDERKARLSCEQIIAQAQQLAERKRRGRKPGGKNSIQSSDTNGNGVSLTEARARMAERDAYYERALAQPRSITQEFCGDPLVGRSALDRKRGVTA